MILFENRSQAGKLLAEKLKKYKNDRNVIVLGLPRGGVVLAFEVASTLSIPLDITCPRKIGAPSNPEFAIGAVTESGEAALDERTIVALGISPDYLHKQIEKETKESKRRLELYRQGRQKIPLQGKVVILVDDGLATGATMKAAIQSVRAEDVEKVVVAVPVSPTETFAEIEERAEEVICLATPSDFYAVGQFYEDFSATEDEEVIRLLSLKSQDEIGFRG